jgi:hypothetical protein
MKPTIITQDGAITEIERRGGETTIDHMPYGKAGWKHVETRPLEIVSSDPRQGLVLLHAEGWRYYSRRFGSRKATLSYVAGTDDNGPWAVRVPGTIETVGEALAWITPEQVRKVQGTFHVCSKGCKGWPSAYRHGKRTKISERGARYCSTCSRRLSPLRVLRQGDVYAVERQRDCAKRSAAKLTGHTWDTDTRILHHDDEQRPHQPLHVPFPCTFVQQRVYTMGRTSNRTNGD